MQTVGATGTSIAPASIAVTGDYRHFEVPEASTLIPTSMVHTDSNAIAVDVFLPVLPAREDKRDNALSITGEFVTGAGIGDLYTGLNSGVQFPAIPNNTGLANTPTWPQNVDNGLVTYDIDPGGFALHPIRWTSGIAGLQYYLPGLKGRVWISGNVLAHRVEQYGRLRAAAHDGAEPAQLLLPDVDRRRSGRARTGGTRTSSSTRSPACASAWSSRRSTTTTSTATPPRTTAPQVSGFFIF